MSSLDSRDLNVKSAIINIHLLLSVAAGDHLAFTELCRLCRPRLLKYANRLVCQSAVDDIVQDCLMAVWVSAGQFSPSKAAPLTWIIAILRNKAIDHRRADAQSRRWQHETVDGTLDWHSPIEQPELAVERMQSTQQLGRSMAVLKTPQRTAIELAFFQDLSYEEVAKRMSIPLGTAKTLIRRGQVKLHANLHPRYKAHLNHQLF